MIHNKGKFLLRLGLLALLLAAVNLTTAPPAFAQTDRYVDPAGGCNTLTPCYTTISAAVAASGPGDTIYVFPGTYAESVDLSSMATGGDISLITVNATGTLTPGTATVSPTTGPAFYSSLIPFPGDITLDGFIVSSPDDDGIDVGVNSDVVIRNVTANSTAGDGIYVYQASANVEITGCTTNNNALDGVEVLNVTGNVTIINSTANGNNTEGVTIHDVDGNVEVTDTDANLNVGTLDSDGITTGYVAGNVTVTNCTTNQNGDDGIDIDNTGGDVTVTGCTANQNVDESGIDIQYVDGDVTITSSTANGNGDNGFTVWDVGQNVTLTNCTAGQNDDDGIDVWDVAQSVTINTCTAGQNDDDGIDVDDVGGDVTISGCTTNQNGDGVGVEDGVEIGEEEGVLGDVEITECTSNGNDDDGFEVDGFGDATVSDSSADGNGDDGIDLDVDGSVTVSRCTGSNSLGGVPAGHGEGFYLEAGGNVTVSRCTAINNPGTDSDGFVILAGGNVSVDSSISMGNGDDGIEMENLAGGTYQVNGTIICNNTAGLNLTSAVSVNAEGNWWGDAFGPFHVVNNPGGTGNAVIDGTSGGGAGTVDFTPWIDTITPSATVDPVNVGQPTVISFQFSDSGKTIFLGQGPGDPNGTPPFTLTTDNGNLTDTDEMDMTVHEFINQPNGILSVTLVPDTAGTATVTLDGPCDLDDSITVQVEGAPPPMPVGGIVVPVNKLELLAPWLGLVALAALVALTVELVRRRRSA